ncbi:MAG: hypothetical protein PHC88_12045 [Terrimicrobiaceae bacterium]|nr:hypothetical protein [Terrimicrobiaceae bacterium]
MMAATTTSPDTQRDATSARRRRSPAWRVIHFLGSLKLALLLLATIAIACAVATFCESRFDTKVAQAYIYKAPWFVVWLGLLCVNLFAVTLTRWPWQRKHLGFVITHYGIITLLIGALIGSKFGFEGNVTLHRGAPPLDRITTGRSVLQIENPATGEFPVEPFDAQFARPTEARPTTIPAPGTPWVIRIDAHTENLGWDEHLVADDSPRAQPGIEMTFASRMMGQHLALPFVFRDGGAMARDFFGLAKIMFLDRLPARRSILISESQLVFAKYASVVQSADGASTGVRAALSADGGTVRVTLPDGRSTDLDRARIFGQPQKLGAATITVSEYWPDFELVAGKPRTASNQPNNPAALVRVEAPHPGAGREPRLEIAPTPSGIAYQLSRGDFLVSHGAARVGEPFPLGWADWSATLAKSLPKARIDSHRRPGATGMPGEPGLRAQLVGPDGATGPAQWIGYGDTATLAFRDASVRVGYGLESRRVPFTIGLKHFEVPRLEGTETPANFISTVEFRDAQTGAAQEGVAEMNHPASWPGGAFALATGLNYKFSQAQWNPKDLDETTLQVLYDPGWLFKWSGSLAICAGIFIMFYLRPKKK